MKSVPRALLSRELTHLLALHPHLAHLLFSYCRPPCTGCHQFKGAISVFHLESTQALPGSTELSLSASTTRKDLAPSAGVWGGSHGSAAGWEKSEGGPPLLI